MNQLYRYKDFDPTAIENGKPVAVAPGILLLRLPLSIRLNHVNVYLFEDHGGWTVYDTGMAEPGCYAGWENALAGVLSSKPIVRIIVSHFHVDHVGLAGWLHERFAPSFHMSQSEYLLSRVFEMEHPEIVTKRQTAFLCVNGIKPHIAAEAVQHNLTFGRRRTPAPDSFHRLSAGDFIAIGGRKWQILTGGGHSIEQAMLYCAADGLLIAGDQIMVEISPNISVGAMLPDGDPLGDYLASLAAMRITIPPDCAIFAGHRRPFMDLPSRVKELEDHHASRCDAIVEACLGHSLTAAELIPTVFERDMPAGVMGSALGEVLAHANYLLHRGKLIRTLNASGTYAFSAA